MTKKGKGKTTMKKDDDPKMKQANDKTLTESDGRKNKDYGPGTQAVVVQTGGNLSGLPVAVQRALSKYKTKEKVGVAPNWIHKDEGDFIIGTIASARQAGQFQSWVITIQATVIGNAKDQSYKEVNQALAVWLSTDLMTKLNAEEDGLVGRHVCIQFDGVITKEENARLKGDMKIYTVNEFFPDAEKED